MKILYLQTHYGIPDSRCEKEMLSLGKKHEVEFFGWNRECTYSGIRESKIRIANRVFLYRHIGIKAPTGEGLKKIFFKLLSFWKQEFKFLIANMANYDVIHACDFDSAFPLLFLRRCPPIVYDIFDYYADTHAAPFIMDKMIRALEGRIIQKADTTIICSEERAKQISPAKPKKLTVIHNTPDNSFCVDHQAGKAFKLNKQKLTIAYVGTLSEDRFLREMAEVISHRNDCEWHIGGIGVLTKYFERLAGKCEHIIFYGKMEYYDALSLEKQCDIMTAIYNPCVPNHHYAAPNKFYEALMLKKPLIMMRNTGMDAYVEKYRLGKIIDGGEKTFQEEFSHALDDLIAQRNEWTEMGERGYQLYTEQFSWDEMERRLLNLYDELQSPAKPAGENES